MASGGPSDSTRGPSATGAGAAGGSRGMNGSAGQGDGAGGVGRPNPFPAFPSLPREGQTYGMPEKLAQLVATAKQRVFGSADAVVLPPAPVLKPSSDATPAAAFDAATSAKLHSQCEAHIREAKHRSPAVKYIINAIEKKGCTVPADFIKCAPCGVDTRLAGGFVLSRGSEGVVLCEEVTDRTTIRQTLAHELIHAFDVCRAHFDANSCYHHACTEIRAANLSTDCSFSAEMGRGNLGFGGHHQKCVKRRAYLSIADKPWCAGKNPAAVIEEVFERCYADTAPFPDAP